MGQPHQNPVVHSDLCVFFGRCLGHGEGSHPCGATGYASMVPGNSCYREGREQSGRGVSGQERAADPNRGTT